MPLIVHAPLPPQGLRCRARSARRGSLQGVADENVDMWLYAKTLLELLLPDFNSLGVR